MFVGAVADNFGEKVRQKVFHAQIVVDSERVKREEKTYKPLPEIYSFRDEKGRDTMQQEVQDNYRRIKKEVEQIIQDELKRIERTPELAHLLKSEEK